MQKRGPDQPAEGQLLADLLKFFLGSFKQQLPHFAWQGPRKCVWPTCRTSGYVILVGTNAESVGYRERAHRWRGADVAAMWWTADEAAKGGLDARTNVVEYLGREGSKWGQKSPPLGFTGVGRYWGIVGPPGFKREKQVDGEAFANEAVWEEFLRRQARWVAWKRLRAWQGSPPPSAHQRRERDGMTAFGLTKDQADRMLKWSVAAAERKRLRRKVGVGSPAET